MGAAAAFRQRSISILITLRTGFASRAIRLLLTRVTAVGGPWLLHGLGADRARLLARREVATGVGHGGWVARCYFAGELELVAGVPDSDGRQPFGRPSMWSGAFGEDFAQRAGLQYSAPV